MVGLFNLGCARGITKQKLATSGGALYIGKGGTAFGTSQTASPNSRIASGIMPQTCQNFDT